MVRMWRNVVLTALLCAATAVAATAGVAATGGVASGGRERSDSGTETRRCVEQFGAAVRAYATATRERDAERYKALVHDGYTIVSADGEVRSGKADSMAFVEELFADPSWRRTLHERRRVVSGCDTGFVLFDSEYSKPADGHRARLRTGLGFTRADGRWLVLHDQSSRVGR
ncbi:nuclear transport factor 2 family protein [Streptomyces sp. G45]|uniref:nuclear transport factor 2 family protein n=1 Tax=Streptomyces sp. G45 TaxID=3406627 RepID=UPI003C2078AF